MLLVLFVLAVRLVWGWYAGRQLAAELAHIRARGEPVLPSELKYDPSARALKVLNLQLKAANALSRTTISPSNASPLTRSAPGPGTALWLSQAQAAERANAPAFALVRQSRALPPGQHRPRRRYAPLYMSSSDDLASYPEFFNAISDSAIYLHLLGDDPGALQRLFDLLCLCRTLRLDDYWYSQLAVDDTEALACWTAQQLAPGIGADLLRAQDAQTRILVARLIAQLLDTKPLLEGMRWTAISERAAIIDETRYVAASFWILRPMVERAIVQTSRSYTTCIDAAGLDNYPAVESLFQRYQLTQPNPSSDLLYRLRATGVRRWPDRIQVEAPGLSRFRAKFHVIADRRATAVSLACQLYRADHGDWPANLQALVPRYLPAVPPDPFFEDGRAIGYVLLKGKLPGGGDRPLVYFDRGTGKVQPPGPMEPPLVWTGPRWYLDIAQPVLHRSP